MAGGGSADPDSKTTEVAPEDRPTVGDLPDTRPGLSDRPKSRVGEVLEGRWRLLELLGSGGMSNVYRASHVSLGRVVAVKLLLPELASSALYARRVLREGRAANAVSHPNVVRVEDIGIDSNGAPYLVQEFLQGMDLWDYAATQRGLIPPEQLVAWMTPVLDALATLHEAGIIHRDLKPANVFLVKEGDGWSPRLLDFGLASLTGFMELPRITASDVTLGTPAYMSPEQIRDPRNLTPRSDLWSVGVLLYEMLSGVLPFQSDNVGTFVIAINSELPVPLRRRAPWVGSGVAALVMQCLEKDPRHRPASARALLQALSTARATTTAPPPSGLDGDAIRPGRSSIPTDAELVVDPPRPSSEPPVASDRPGPTPEPPVAPEPEPALAPSEALEAAAPIATVEASEPPAPVEAAPTSSMRWWMVTVVVAVICVVAWAVAYGLPAE